MELNRSKQMSQKSMQIDESLEEKLWSVSNENPLDKDTCNQIIDYLLAGLSDYLQQPLNLAGDNWLDGDAFSTTFRGVIAPQDPFRITFVGTLGMETIGKERTPRASASLFLFGDHYRLSAGAPNRSFIEVFYERGQNNFGQWRSLGWEIDEFDEYEDIVEDEYYYRGA